MNLELIGAFLLVFWYPIVILIELLIEQTGSSPKDGKYKHFAAPSIGKHRYERWQTYMKSRAWSNFKKRVYKQRGNICERCGTIDGEKHVHHLTYERLGSEKLTDCVILCVPCHNQIHSKRR